MCEAVPSGVAVGVQNRPQSTLKGVNVGGQREKPQLDTGSKSTVTFRRPLIHVWLLLSGCREELAGEQNGAAVCVRRGRGWPAGSAAGE